MNYATAERLSPSQEGAASTDLYRLLLLRKRGAEILATGGPAYLRLPCVEIPRWQRIAENITAKVRDRYRLPAICLFALDSSIMAQDCPQTRYQVLEIPESASETPEGTWWMRSDSITESAFADEQDAAAIVAALAQIREAENEQIPRPFAHPGWIEKLFLWVEQETKPLGIRLLGGFRQLNASPTFALLRLETNGPSLWFKAVGEPNLREFPISVTLSQLFPDFVPAVVATHAKWHGWLTTEFPGTALSELPVGKDYECAAATLAQLQTASLDKTDLLLAAGCMDLRVSSLLRLVEPFLEVMSEQMERQEKTHPPALKRQQLRTLTAQTKEALLGWAALHIPDSLGHLDFNPGNILCSSEQCIFLDWAEAYIGPPFMTFEYFCEHLHRMGHVQIDASLRRHYTRPWESLLSPALIAQAQILVPLVSVFAYAAAAEDWRDPVLLAQSGRAPYLRSLTRRMLREVEVLCVPSIPIA